MILKHFLVIFCLIGAVSTQLSAQNGNKSISFWKEVYWYVPVFCEDQEQETDFVLGYAFVHFVETYKNDELVYAHTNSNMTAESLVTGEEFKYIETDKYDIVPDEPGLLQWQRYKFTLKGNQGSHYVGFLYVKIYDADPDPVVELIPINTHCR